MPVEIRNSSRLKFADLVIVDDVEFWDTLVLPDPVSRQDDITHTVTQTDRIDLLADRYYQDAGLWWVIAWANNLDILPTDMNEGAQLRIPSKAYVISELLKNATRRA
jgi:nucleoid-associated protein YgaU